jgi:hypothetical protein
LRIQCNKQKKPRAGGWHSGRGGEDLQGGNAPK